MGRPLLVYSLALLGILSAGAVLSYYFLQRLGEIDEAISAQETRVQLLHLAETHLLAAGRDDPSRFARLSRLNQALSSGAELLSPEERRVVESARRNLAGGASEAEHINVLAAAITTQTQTLSQERADIRRYMIYSISGGAVLLAAALMLVTWRIQTRFTRCMDRLERKIQLIEAGDDGVALTGLESDDEVGAIFSALDEMAKAVGARQVEQALTRHLIAEKKRVSDLVNMALGMADEVGNPLTAIEGAIDLLHKCWKENLLDAGGTRRDQGQASEYFAVLRDQVTRIVWVLRQIKNLNIFSGSQRELSDINEIIQSMMTLVKLDKRIHNSEVALELDTGLPAVVLDRAQVALSFLYLIERAVDGALPAGGRVAIASACTEDVVTVTIRCSDMDPAACRPDECVLPFRPGARAETRQDFELSSVRAAITAHGGKLTVFCEPQIMCGVILELPIHSPEDVGTGPEEVGEAPVYRQAGGM